MATIDFKALAQEREARRTKKRERSISPPTLRDSRKAPRLQESTVTLASGARLTSLSSLVQGDQRGRKSEIASAATAKLQQRSPAPTIPSSSNQAQQTSSSSTTARLQYPNGVVKKTWAFRHDRTGKDIKIEEVLESSTLRTAVLSAYQWDMDWIFTKLRVPANGGSTKCVFVMQGDKESLRNDMLKQTEDMRPWLRLCFPPMEGQTHCMHSKLMLLFHPNKLRVAIPTANLLNFDWGETGVMENSVFLIDLPRLPDKAAVTDLTAFGQELLHFMMKSGFDEDIRDGILSFDFKETEHIAFIHSVGGISYGDEAQRTGLPGLARAVRHHRLQTTDLEIDFAASSIGSLNDEYLRTVHAAATGEDLIERAASAAAKSKAKSSTPRSESDHGIRDKIRIVFPTQETVHASATGACGTVCLSRKWFEAMTFPRRCFRDYISTRQGLLSHNKILYARGLRKDEDDKPAKDIAWAYVGSANMSESAWGKLVLDKKDKKWRINCRNWECGVLLPIFGGNGVTDGDYEGSREGDKVGMEVFDDVVEPPFLHPAPEFEGKEPWYFLEKS